MKTDNKGIYVWDRQAGKMVKETVLGDRFLRLAYSKPLRPLSRLLLYKWSFLSKLIGMYCDSGISAGKIPSTISELDISEDEMLEPVDSFKTFNEFFCRKLKPESRPFERAPHAFLSPADSRLSVYSGINDDMCVPVKGQPFSVDDLLGTSKGGCKDFYGGDVLVFRLCPADYHRFHYPDDGKTLECREIKGAFESVNPISLNLAIPVFAENRRTISILELMHFGKIAYVEVGAFGVGAIVQTHTDPAFKRMDEKGLFKFGGSTLVLVFPRGTLLVSEDILSKSREGIETLVKTGETIGEKMP